MNLYFPMISINWLLFHKIKYHNIELLPTMNTGIGFDLNLKSKSEWKQEFKIMDVFVLYDCTAPKLQKLGLQPSQIIITFITLHW